MSDDQNIMLTSPAQSVLNRHNRRVKLGEQQLETISREDLVRNWRELDSYVEVLESQSANQEAELTSLRESEDRLRQQHSESSHREKVLVRRLATKEQEMQEYANQIAELKAAQAPGAAALRSALLDPAVNLLLQRLRQELLSTRARLEETQNELSAWKFTPDSNTGKRLMAKCRLLYQENEELGRMISSGRLAKLEGDLALQKSFSEEVKKSQSELDEFLQDLDEDVEGMQSTIYYLQQELRKAKEALTALQQENNLLKTGSVASSEHQEGLGDSEVGRESRPRTPLSRNGIQDKGEEDSRGWEERTQGSDRGHAREHSASPNRSPRAVESTLGGKGGQEQKKSRKPVTEEDSVSCDDISPNRNRATSPPDSSQRQYSEAYVARSQSPAEAIQNRTWDAPKCDRDDSSSDSGELIIKLESEDMGDEELESRDSNIVSLDNKGQGKNDRRGSGAVVGMGKVADCGDSAENVDKFSVRKRTCPSDDSSNDSDNVPLIKKVRRDSEISLHYNEDDDETGLTNGESTLTADNDEK